MWLPFSNIFLQKRAVRLSCVCSCVKFTIRVLHADFQEIYVFLLIQFIKGEFATILQDLNIQSKMLPVRCLSFGNTV